jgi:hypothetical protein
LEAIVVGVDPLSTHVTDRAQREIIVTTNEESVYGVETVSGERATHLTLKAVLVKVSSVALI